MTQAQATKPEVCPRCGAEMAWRQAYPYPVWVQSLFAVSFLAFLILFDRVSARRELVWAWSAIQIGLGALLIRLRLRAKKTILRCIRCHHDIR